MFDDSIVKALTGAKIASVLVTPGAIFEDEVQAIELYLDDGCVVRIVPYSMEDSGALTFEVIDRVVQPGLKTVRDLHYNYGGAYGENATIVFSNRVAVVVCFTMGDTPYSVSASRRGESIFEYWDITESHANVLLAELQQMSK